ncbi:methylenetetrahydrofolate reductase [Candidatus Magnetaquicoccus inordinatus]|uniref:methylenetetrahydrofolate reductase n=1 Tax=Candidatus Magnetaquicoccus inordinatus TaxID=2496818 RepID=UPI00102AFF6E|nr:methylenetetrahydrofolate reductase [Candidatus Magnetaquicoccus inordinatus]
MGAHLVPTRISVELVPRDTESLQHELQAVQQAFPAVSVINLPDLPRFPVRSWDGCVIAKRFFTHTIPHIRVIDLPAEQAPAMLATLSQHQIQEILLVTGDPQPDMPEPQNSLTLLQAIPVFKQALPGVKIYTALDPYRQDMAQEYDYLQQKLAAGSDGFFTQPFFAIPPMEQYAARLPGVPIFWGVAPVTSESSRAYWEKRNRVTFPEHFAPTLEWNKAFAREALQFVRAVQSHIYFMPIRTPVVSYLQGVLD